MKQDATGLPIAAVERETGISKDTLRVWEKRYGFPQPWRDEADDRLYPAAQVQRLQLIRRLLDLGLRPGKIVPMPAAELQQLIDNHPSLSKTNKEERPPHQDLSQLLEAIAAHDQQALRHALSLTQLRLGLQPFVLDVVAPLTTAVGDAWAKGRFQVFEEHLFTEVVTGVLRHCIAALAYPPVAAQPRILLTTLSQEIHGLGLLMVEALLALEGCGCTSLGTQTPIADVVLAAQAHRVDVVVLSFTNMHSPAVIHSSLTALRQALPASIQIWVGGACSALYQRPLPGIRAMQELTGLATAVREWRESQNCGATPHSSAG